MQKIQELDDSIVKYSEELSKIQDQTNTLEKEIEETDKQLAKNQEEYKKKENLFKRRVVALYEAGETTYLDVLLSSKGLMDFLSNYYMIEEIMQYDNELLQEVENRKNEIEAQKNEQEKRKPHGRPTGGSKGGAPGRAEPPHPVRRHQSGGRGAEESPHHPPGSG